MEESEEQDKY